MDNQFETSISTHTTALPTSSLLCAEQHWRNAL
ncbi:protein YdgV [Pseudocitrobacter vendiensis]